MSVGMVLLTAVAVLIYFGVTQRVLDRMYLTDKGALLIAATMFFGGLIPNLRIGLVEVNIGGGIVPLAVCAWLIAKAQPLKEKWRPLLGAVLTAAAVYWLGKLMPDEPEAIRVDPNYAYGIAAGLIAYILGRSRRGAFICGVLGVALADGAVALINWRKGVDQPLVIGGAGMFDVMVIAGLTGVLLAELVGEVAERLTRGTNPPDERPIEKPVKDKEGGKA